MTEVKPGDRIRLIVQPHDPDPLPPGSEGTVTEVAALAAPMPSTVSVWSAQRPVVTGLPAPDIEAVVAVEWDSGSRRRVLLPLDRIEVIARGDP